MATASVKVTETAIPPIALFGKTKARSTAACAIATPVFAEPLLYGDQTYVDLELYLVWRAKSLPIETPAVRRYLHSSFCGAPSQKTALA